MGIRINIVIEETFKVSVEAFNLLNLTEPEKMKVAELRAALQERGLDTKGTKPVLVARLQEAIEAEKKEPTPEPESEKVEESEAMEETPAEEAKEEVKEEEARRQGRRLWKQKK